MRRFSLVLGVLLGCSTNAATRVDDGGMRDAGPMADDAGVVVPNWHAAHCEDRECYFVMQDESGADNLTCNGRHPTDLETVDDQGLRNCPFAGFDSPTLRRLMAPVGEPNVRRSFFVGDGRYPVWPDGLDLRGDGTNAEESVLLSAYRGADVTLDGASCPDTCTLQTNEGTFTWTPCCALRCPTCDADPMCQPLLANGIPTGECGVPWDKVYRPLTISGSWLRVEGLRIEGCANDALVVSARRDATGGIVPNGEIFVTNNVIGGCDINENIKAFRQGPGPHQGGPTWGRTHVIGNELFGMNSQAVDATGVHNWLVEESYVHDAKIEHPIPGQEVDGGGIGFKNGGSQARVRNNWMVRGGGFALGGGSGSCVEDPDGCFQEFEMTDMLVENNMSSDSAMQDRSGTGAAIGVFHCDNCRVIGNAITQVATKHAVYISDECPGPRCSYNPRLLPSRDLLFSNNFFTLGRWSTDPRLFMGYPRDVFVAGPAANGMRSTDNTFCAADGTPPEFGGPESPAETVALWYHIDPNENLPFRPRFAPQIGDTGSRVFNHADAPVDACPRTPPVCDVGVSLREGVVRWRGPTCPSCTCALVFDDDDEVPVECSGERPLSATNLVGGRHYVGLRVAGTMATGCGSSYDVAAKMRGAGCSVRVDAEMVRWTSEGAVTCSLVADGDIELGTVPCRGQRPLPTQLAVPGRHHLRLQVSDSALGQTTCGAMFSR